MTTELPYEFWREYPERDPQAVVWYPCTYGTLNPDDIWAGENLSGSGPADIGYYLHVPFCKRICKFCPFNKFQWSPEVADHYVETVKQEIRSLAARPFLRNSRIIAGYLGGGTPTCLETRQLVDLITCCSQQFHFAQNFELCVEATPDTVDEEKLRALRELGVNRISIGVQSFNPRLLSIMGRAQSPQQARRAVELAHKVGFPVISIDLLYRVPGQTLLDWEADLRQAVELDLNHLTTFSLGIDPGTALHAETTQGKIIPQPGEDTELTMYRMAVEFLSQAGYRLYTLYDFERHGEECRHHAINWQAPQGSYVGFGPGAFSFIDGLNGAYIYCNRSDLEDYTQSVRQGIQPVDFGKKLSREEEMSRYMVLGVNFLRLPGGPFRERFGVAMTQIYGEEIARLASWGLVRMSEGDMELTDKGKIYLANVSKTFFTDENRGKPHIIGVELQKGEGLSLVGLDRDNRGQD